MSINNWISFEKNGAHQVDFSVVQLTRPNFLQVISDKQIISRVVMFDQNGNELNNLSIEKIFNLMGEAYPSNISTNSIHVVLHEKTEKISLFSNVKLDKNAASIFDLQNVRMIENYHSHKSDSEYVLWNYFTKLLKLSDIE